MEFLEIESVANPNGWAMETVAPHDVITILDPAYARVILVIAESAFWISIDPLDDGIVQFPIDPVLAEAAMHIHVACLIIAAEYARECAIKRHNRAVENTVGRWDQISRYDRVATIPPDYLAISGRSVFPRNVWQGGG